MARKIDGMGFNATLRRLGSSEGLDLKAHAKNLRVTERTVRNWIARMRREGRRIVKDGDGRYREVPCG